MPSTSLGVSLRNKYLWPEASGWPNLPSLPQPHVNTNPPSVTAQLCIPPADTWTTLWCEKCCESIVVSVYLELWSPRPSFPLYPSPHDMAVPSLQHTSVCSWSWFLPNVYKSPVLVTIATWAYPQLTWVTSPIVRMGVGTWQSCSLPLPNTPYLPAPHE